MLATLAAIRVAARDGEAEHLWHRTNNRWFEFYINKNQLMVLNSLFSPGTAVSLKAMSRLHIGGI